MTPCCAPSKSAAQVDPGSITDRTVCGPGLHLLARRRPPGEVELHAGHREHLLMCTSGTPVAGQAVRSVLRTDDAQLSWSTCPRNRITFVPAGLPMHWSWTYQSSSTHLVLAPAFLDDVRSRLAESSGATEPVGDLTPAFRVPHEVLAALLAQLREETLYSPPGTDLVTSSLLNLIAVNVLRAFGPSPQVALPRAQPQSQAQPDGPANAAGYPLAVLRAVERLHDNLGERVTLEELANEHHYSPWHFARLFKQHTGMPPHRYQINLRVSHAMRWLTEQPQRSLADIAATLGFADESHFRRHFKRITGKTPKQYRLAQ